MTFFEFTTANHLSESANPIRDIKAICKMTNRSLSERFGIPIRTVEDWSSGARCCPTYTWQMIAYISFTDFGII